MSVNSVLPAVIVNQYNNIRTDEIHTPNTAVNPGNIVQAYHYSHSYRITVHFTSSILRAFSVASSRRNRSASKKKNQLSINARCI